MLSLYEDWRGERLERELFFLSLFNNTNKLVLLMYIVLYSPLFNLKQKEKKNEKNINAQQTTISSPRTCQ